MPKTLYELKYSFEAPDLLKSEQVGCITKLYFPKGKVLFGEPYKKDRIIVDKRFVFPIEYLEKTNKLSNLDIKGVDKEVLDRISTEVTEQKQNFLGEDKKSTITEKIKKESNTYKSGALLGLGIGIVTALYLKKSVLWFGLFGGAFGGYIASQINKAKKGNNLDIKPK
jgi:hypothetical protein